MISRRQCKAARALLGWTQRKLAQKSGIPLDTVKRFERGISDTRGEAMRALENTIRDAGVKLIPPEHGEGEGLKFAKAQG